MVVYSFTLGKEFLIRKSKNVTQENQRVVQTGTKLSGFLLQLRWWALPIRKLLLCFLIVPVKTCLQWREWNLVTSS